jgi:hypothetical protein
MLQRSKLRIYRAIATIKSYDPDDPARYQITYHESINIQDAKGGSILSPVT